MDCMIPSTVYSFRFGVRNFQSYFGNIYQYSSYIKGFLAKGYNQQSNKFKKYFKVKNES